METITYFLKQVNMNVDEMTPFLEDCQKALTQFEEELECLCREYQKFRSMDDLEAKRNELAEKSGISTYTLHALILILSSGWLFKEYEAQGISQEIFWDTMSDLKCKLIECYKQFGIWGTSVKSWYDGIFRMNIFKLGRLEFERREFPMEETYELGGCTFAPGDRVYSVHIPSCGPLTRESRLDSYKRAYEFFEQEREGKPLRLYLRSWLIYGQNRVIFPPHMNIVDFQNDWKLIESCEVEGYPSCRTLFDCVYPGDPDKLPADTTARRAMVAWLKQGKPAGYGTGIMVFDGEQMIV